MLPPSSMQHFFFSNPLFRPRTEPDWNIFIMAVIFRNKKVKGLIRMSRDKRSVYAMLHLRNNRTIWNSVLNVPHCTFP